MLLDARSRREMPVRRHGWRAVGLGAALVWGCATGVDVTDEELEAICNDTDNRCVGVAAGTGGTSPVASTGGTSSSTSRGGTFGAPPGNGGSVSTTGGTGNTGTGGNNAGTGGSSGTGSTSPQPLAEGDCLAESDVTITYRDRSTGSNLEDEPTMVLSVQNPGGQTFNLADLTIRYWFTADGAGAFTGNVDYASLGGGQNGLQSSNVTVSFAQEFGSDYAQLSFTSTATVDANGVDEVQLRFHGTPYQPMDQTNDFSFIANAPDGTPNPNITPYLSGVQVGGCVPIAP